MIFCTFPTERQRHSTNERLSFVFVLNHVTWMSCRFISDFPPQSWAALVDRPTQLICISDFYLLSTEQARNLERCALKAEKLQHGKLKNLYTDISPCGKRNAEKTSIWLSAYFA